MLSGWVDQPLGRMNQSGTCTVVQITAIHGFLPAFRLRLPKALKTHQRLTAN